MSRRIFFLLLFILTNLSLCIAQKIKSHKVVTDEETIKYEQQMKNMTAEQMDELLSQKGLQQSEIDQIKTRVNGSKAGNPNEPVKVVPRELPENDFRTFKKKSDPQIFGSSFFTTPSLAFEPNLRIATPVNYILGPDDELQISISGYQEANFKVQVQPEGSIIIPQVGVINVAGLTIDEATKRIRSRMIQSAYPNLSNGSTRLSISLGKIRSIHITIIGASKPGNYTVSSLTTVFNSLYLCGGPDSINSYREIELIRNNRVYRKIDLYQFLTKGDLSGNVLLKEGDVVNFPVYKKRVQVKGQVKRQGIFEMLEGESLEKLLFFAGDFTDKAYKSGVRIKQNTETERKIKDISKAQFSIFQLTNGDEIIVDEIPQRLENGVSISGAIYRPGQFELTPGLTLSALIKKSGGLQDDAFLPRGILSRTNENRTKESISFQLNEVLTGKHDIALQKWDSIQIASVTNFMDEYYITVEGEVRKPNTYPFRKNLSLKDVLFLAGGLTDAGSAYNIEVGRRLTKDVFGYIADSIAKVYTINTEKNLDFNDSSFILMPFDIITIRRSPGYKEQKRVTISGEVVYPGAYTITSKTDRISDLLKRAGGLTPSAYLGGVSLVRSLNSSIVTDTIRKERITLMQRSIKDAGSKVIEDSKSTNVKIAIDTRRVLNEPGSNEDYILEEGDVIEVSKIDPLVKISGEVLLVSKTNYEHGRSLKYYLRRAGGTTANARLSRAYIVYANGELDKTNSSFFGLIRDYPKVKTGSEIVIPGKVARKRLSTAETIGLTSSIVSVLSLVVVSLNLLK